MLADALGVRGLDFVTEQRQYFPSVTAHDWAAPWPQTRVGCLEHLDPGAGTVLLTDHDGVPCGVEVSAGSGRVVLFAAELPSNLHLFGRAFARLGATARLSLTSSVPGVFGLTSADESGQRLVHLRNITGHRPQVRVGWRGAEPRALTLPARTGVMLPLGLVTGLGVIDMADAELVEVSSERLVFGPGLAGEASEIRLRGARPPVEGGVLSGADDSWLIQGAGPSRSVGQSPDHRWPSLASRHRGRPGSLVRRASGEIADQVPDDEGVLVRPRRQRVETRSQRSRQARAAIAAASGCASPAPAPAEAVEFVREQPNRLRPHAVQAQQLGLRMLDHPFQAGHPDDCQRVGRRASDQRQRRGRARQQLGQRLPIGVIQGDLIGAVVSNAAAQPVGFDRDALGIPVRAEVVEQLAARIAVCPHHPPVRHVAGVQPHDGADPAWPAADDARDVAVRGHPSGRNLLHRQQRAIDQKVVHRVTVVPGPADRLTPMIKHIVAWNFADEAEGADKATNVALAAKALRELPDKVPGILEFEVITPQDGLDTSFDLALYSVFTDADALSGYAVHPAHLPVVALIKARVTGRSVIDYDPAESA